MTTRKPTAPKTSTELKKQLEVARKRLAALEQRAYAEELTEKISETSIVADFKKILASVGDIQPTAILTAIATAAGLKRIQVSQLPASTRAPADPTKPKKPRAPTKSKGK